MPSKKKNEKSIRVLIVGDSPPRGKVFSLAREIRDLGNEVKIYNIRPQYSPSLINRLWNKVVRIPRYFFTEKLNIDIQEKVSIYQPNLILFFKPILIWPETITRIKEGGTVVFSWHSDDAFNSRNASIDYYKSIPLYDAHFFQNPLNVKEAEDYGAHRAFYFPPAVDSEMHYPVDVSGDERDRIGADVVFVGTYEKYRAGVLEQLCRAGYDIKVYGNQWKKAATCFCLRKKRCIMGRTVYYEDLSRVLNASKIALGFVRKANRDEHNSRTYETPACGAFLLHERTDVVTNAFFEGEEIACFDSFTELKKKIDYYLANPEKRKQIARHGYEAAIQYEHTHAARANTIIRVFHERKGKP